MADFVAPIRSTVDMPTLRAIASAHRLHLSDAEIFGLASPLGFFYFANPQRTPSRWIIGTRENLGANLKALFDQSLPRGELIRAALLDNSLAFNFDRAPHEAILGMEFLAEELEAWGELPGANKIAQALHYAMVTEPPLGAFWRGLYLQFLRKAVAQFPPGLNLLGPLETICTGWTHFADLLSDSHSPREQFAKAALQIRKLASCEEYFWGSVMDVTR